MVSFVQIPIVPVVVATVLQMLLGMVWYGPLFGKTWMRLVHLPDRQPTSAEIKRSMTLGTLATFIATYFLAVLLVYIRPLGVQEAMVYTLIFWAAGALPQVLSGIAWENRSVSLLKVNGLYTLLAAEIAAVTIVGWPW